MRALLPDFLFSGGHVQAATALIVRDGKVLGAGKPPEGAEVIPMRGRLLRVAYARSGFRLPQNPRQKRFIEGSADEYLQNLDALSRQVPVGAAPHSVRACPAEWIRDIAAEAFRRGWPLHLHVSEQRAEVEQSQPEHGARPALCLDRLGLLPESP